MNIEKIKVLSFSSGNFNESQNFLKTHLLNNNITNITFLNDLDLGVDFLNTYSNILKHKRGFGYCIWKPYIILKELMKLGDDEVLFYIDSTDLPELKLFDFIVDHFKENNYLLFNRGYNHGEWTKRDTFVLMGCDSEYFYRSTQLEAGDMVLKKTDENVKLILEWFEYCKNENILTELPNICNLPNLPGFKEHRYDQSILTNLALKYNLNSIEFDGSMIKYNYNQPKIY